MLLGISLSWNLGLIVYLGLHLPNTKTSWKTLVRVWIWIISTNVETLVVWIALLHKYYRNICSDQTQLHLVMLNIQTTEVQAQI